MSEDIFENEKKHLTPNQGFNLVSIDYFAPKGDQLYLTEHFERYQDALKAKKERKNPSDYFILYKGPRGEFFCN